VHCPRSPPPQKIGLGWNPKPPPRRAGPLGAGGGDPKIANMKEIPLTPSSRAGSRGGVACAIKEMTIGHRAQVTQLKGCVVGSSVYAGDDANNCSMFQVSVLWLVTLEMSYVGGSVCIGWSPGCAHETRTAAFGIGGAWNTLEFIGALPSIPPPPENRTRVEPKAPSPPSRAPRRRRGRSENRKHEGNSPYPEQQGRVAWRGRVRYQGDDHRPSGSGYPVEGLRSGQQRVRWR